MVGHDIPDLNDITDVFFLVFLLVACVFPGENSTKMSWLFADFCCQVAVRVDLRSAQKLIHATESCKKCKSFAEFSTKVSCCHSKINGCLQKKKCGKNMSHPLTFLLYCLGLVRDMTTGQRMQYDTILRRKLGKWRNFQILLLALRCLSTSCYSAYQSHLKDRHLSPIVTASLKQFVPEKYLIWNII